MKIYSSRIYRSMAMCFLIALTITACEKQHPVVTSERPASIPASAFKIGDAYIKVVKLADTAQHIYAGVVYHANGDSWYSGKMGLSPRYAAFDDINDKATYLKWDGNTIYLTKNRTLKMLPKD